MGERLHKLLARAGFAGRLKCEELILGGVVTVNGRPVNELGFKVDPDADRIEVLGEPVKIPRSVYYVLHKPVGVVSTTRDPAGRPRATDYFKHLNVRIFPVGRLDVDSTGLLLMTNDGELANRLTHPRFGVEKTYLAEVRGKTAQTVADGMVAGVWLAEGKARATRVKIVYVSRNKSILEIVLREGRNRQIRRMLAKLGHPVEKLRRVKMGPVSLGTLKPGEYRVLTAAEVAELREAASHAAPPDELPPHAPRTKSYRRPTGPDGAHLAEPAAKPPRAGKPAPARPASGKPPAARPSPGKPRKPGSAPAGSGSVPKGRAPARGRPTAKKSPARRKG
jgi:pseudouridine synthase